MNLRKFSRVILWAGFLAAATVVPAGSAPLSITEVVRLIPSDGAYADFFGLSVASSGDTVAIGVSRRTTPAGPFTGEVRILVRDGSGWSEQARLTPSTGLERSGFGSSVAISGDTVIVGAAADRTGSGLRAGAAYVFVRDGASWSEQAKLSASDEQYGGMFGGSVAIDGDTVVVGANGHDNYRGAAYIFERTGSAWSERAHLSIPGAEPYDIFGVSVAISRYTVIVGAAGDDSYAGAAYVFVRSGSGWVQQAQLIASDREPFDELGYSVAISGDTAVLGALYGEGSGSAIDTGAAYVFERSGSIWSEQTRLVASGAQRWDQFAQSVAISGDTAVMGAAARKSTTGSAYVFVRRGVSWFEQNELLASDGQSGASFGYSVALSGDIAWVGAPTTFNAAVGVRTGGAYAFSLAPEILVAPITGLITREGGGTVSAQVFLKTRPAGDVVLDLVSNDTGEATVAPSQLTFQPDAWWIPQSITLTGVADSVADGSQPYTVTLSVNGGLTSDSLYQNAAPRDVSATNIEDLEGEFFTVTPCRLLDTREPGQGPRLSGGVPRVVTVHGVCEVPTTARTVAVSVFVVQPTGAGSLMLYAGDLTPPGTVSSPFGAMPYWSFNAIVLLATDGTGTLGVWPEISGANGGAAHLIIDTTGYFE